MKHVHACIKKIWHENSYFPAIRNARIILRNVWQDVIILYFKYSIINWEYASLMLRSRYFRLPAWSRNIGPSENIEPPRCDWFVRREIWLEHKDACVYYSNCRGHVRKCEKDRPARSVLALVSCLSGQI